MDQSTNLLIIFLTGLTTGGLSCLAVQGGLLASVISSTEKDITSKLSTKEKIYPLLAFMASKVVAYTVLGFILGLLGSSISLSATARGWMQVIIAIYLAGVAGAMLELHPLFRYFVIKPPKFLMRMAKNQSRSSSLFAPVLLGALTIFLPCGTTQAMEIVALGTGNPLYSALIMFSFTLGTIPTFSLLGFLYSKASQKFNQWFAPVAATLLVGLSIFSLNNGLTLLDSVYTLQNFRDALMSPPTQEAAVVQSVITINVTNSGYSPRQFTIKAGTPTTIKLITNNTFGCSRSFTIPSLNIDKVLPATGTEIVEFTPTKVGKIVFSCSMGMYTGTINVI